MPAELTEFDSKSALNSFIRNHGWEVWDIRVIVTDVQPIEAYSGQGSFSSGDILQSYYLLHPAVS
jgi:hypothetical protein